MTSVQRCLGAAAVVALALAWAPSGLAQAKGDGPPASADPAKIEQAKKHMAAGAALYNDPSGHKCEEAYVEFNKAYELSGSLNALKNRAVCALELEKDGEALLDYKKVLAGIGDKLDPAEKTQIENDVRALEAAVAWITIKIDVPSAKLLDVRTPSRGLPVRNRYALAGASTKLGIHPGDHAFTVSTDDGKEITWKATLANGSTQEHAFDLTKVETGPAPTTTATTTAPTATTTTTAPIAPATERPVPTSVKVLLGVTGALAVGTGVMMGLAYTAKADYDAVNGTGVPTTDLATKRDNVVLMNGIADGLLGGTVLAAGATLVLYLIRPTVQVEPKSGFFIAPAITPSAGGAVAGGRF